jgi:cell wall-associated NlpC family hydrolase
MKRTRFALTAALAIILTVLGSTAPRVSAAGPTPPERSSLLAASNTLIVQTALQYVGYPYVRNGRIPDTGFDDVGFAVFVYRSQGISFPRGYKKALASAPHVAMADLQPGDAVFFKNTVKRGLSHVGIYLGDGKFVHAEWYQYGVTVSSLLNDPKDGNYWQTHFEAANRPWSAAGS